MPWDLARSTALTTFLEFPDVEIAMSTSPGFPSASIHRLKTWS